MHGVSWQNLLMMNATIPPMEKGGEGDGEGGSQQEAEGMDLWEIGNMIMKGKKV